MSEDPRLCYFTYGAGGGHYHYAVNQIRGIHEVNPDVDIDVFYTRADGESHFPDYVSERHFANVEGDRKLLMVLRSTLLQFRLLAYFLRVRPDVVHLNTHLRSQWYTLYVTLVSKLLGIPVVRTVHERTPSRLRDVSPLATYFANQQCRSSDYLIAHTDASKREIEDDGISTPVAVIPHGNYLFFRSDIDATEASPYGDGDSPVVLFFGVKEHKGIDAFLGAVERTETTYDAWVVGPVNRGDEQYARKARDSDSIDTHLEYIPDEDLWKYFHFADIVVLPYTEGTTSGALQLALAFENAVVVSTLPCFAEYVTDGEEAVVLPEVSPRAVADAIDTLVRDPARRHRLQDAGLELAQSSTFDWKVIAKQTLAVYETVSDTTFT